MKYSRSRSKPRKMRLSFGSSASSSSKPICARQSVGAGTMTGIAEIVEIAEVDADAVARRAARRARSRRLPRRGDRTAARCVRQPANQRLGSFAACAVRRSRPRAAAPMRWVSDSRSPATTSGPTGKPERLQRPGRGDNTRRRRCRTARASMSRAQPVAAGDAAVALAIGGVEIGRRARSAALAQGRVGDRAAANLASSADGVGAR